MKMIRSFACLVSVFAIGFGTASADQIYFGHADGFIELRDEFDLLQEIELPGTSSGWISFGSIEAITALEASADNLIIGTRHGTVHVRAHTNLNDNIPNGFAAFTIGVTEQIADLSLRSDGRVHLVGPNGGQGQIWARQETNMGASGIPGDGGVPTGSGSPLLSVASLSNDDAAIGSSAGEVPDHTVDHAERTRPGDDLVSAGRSRLDSPGHHRTPTPRMDRLAERIHQSGRCARKRPGGVLSPDSAVIRMRGDRRVS
jgi:hypothetical protein